MRSSINHIPMPVAGAMPVQPWMKARGVQEVMACLNKSGMSALFVGGCVRNAVLGEPVEDVDIATSHTPDQVCALLDMAGMKHIPTGIAHGTVTAMAQGQAIEITTLRKDIATDGRHATVSYTPDWKADAARRDFTMNTLLADMQGNIYDPLESGLADARNRQVLFVGDPRQRIKEDYLRILRFFRFHALYGSGDPDAGALQACRDYSAQIKTLSRERITQEFFKIILVKHPVPVLALMQAQGILSEMLANGYDPGLLAHLCEFQNRYHLCALSARLLVLIGLDPQKIDALSQTIILPRIFEKDMVAIAAILKGHPLQTEQAVKVAIYKHGRSAAAQALMIALAQDRIRNAFAPAALALIQKWDVPTFPLTGDDLIKQGYKEGLALGKKLDELESEWIANGFCFKAP